MKRKKKTSASIHKIKEDIEQLGKVMLLLEDFEKNLPKKLQTSSDEHRDFMMGLDASSRDHLMKEILELKKIKSSLAISDINDKLGILAYYLGVLKVTTMSKDYGQSKRLIKKFLSQEDLCLHSMIEQVNVFEKDVKKLRTSYLELLNKISSLHKDLEDKADIKFNNSALIKLNKLNKNQKTLLSEIGTQFTEFSKNLIRDKGYREFLKDK